MNTEEPTLLDLLKEEENAIEIMSILAEEESYLSKLSSPPLLTWLVHQEMLWQKQHSSNDFTTTIHLPLSNNTVNKPVVSTPVIPPASNSSYKDFSFAHFSCTIL